ncbi:hypothetical protein D9V41_13700 [Aeromicrobium phragmitis]|uniref:Uncharacterized protein n=1 Tax=Aeromicrobium phragmitis TaxID=2478914 RepID=A0A3L8PLI5_9ACTN|nr:hypothetical protein [Aeromicrobium phragmitis]RLV54872.1 hypothetical protein D9V41_13700 [Aeromicrobium phragmitis]
MMGLIAVFGLVANLPGQGAYPWWVESSAAPRESLAVVALPMTVTSALLGHDLARRGTLLHAAAVGRRARQLAWHVAVLSVAALVGFVAGLTPLWWWTASSATWGAPSIADVLIAVAGIVALNTVMFVLGAMTTRVVWSLLVAVGGALWLLLPIVVDRALSVVSPAWHWSSHPRFSPNLTVATYFVLFAALVVTVAFVWHSRESNRAPRFVAAGGLVGALIMAAYPFAWRPHLYVHRVEAEPTCRVVDGVDICVHPANEKAIPVVGRRISAANEAFGVPLVESFLDYSAADVIEFRPGRVLSNIYPADLTEPLDAALVDQASGLLLCHEPGTSDEENINVAQAISARLGEALGIGHHYFSGTDRRIAELVASFSDREFVQLLRENADQMWRCGLTREDLSP